MLMDDDVDQIITITRHRVVYASEVNVTIFIFLWLHFHKSAVRVYRVVSCDVSGGARDA